MGLGECDRGKGVVEGEGHLRAGLPLSRAPGQLGPGGKVRGDVLGRSGVGNHIVGDDAGRAGPDH